jgi:hypothetical protein
VDNQTQLGLFAKNTGTIENLTVDGDLTQNVVYAAAGRGRGLIVGANGGTITKCISKGSLEGVNIAGICGYNGGTVSLCINHADVGQSYSGSTRAGIVQSNRFGGVVENCYNTGNIRGGNSSGGIVGANGSGVGTVRCCHNVGNITEASTSQGGSAVGKNNSDSTVTACYWDTDKSDTAWGTGSLSDNDPDITGLTSEEMKQASSFDGWDFQDVWYMGNTYPMLLIFKSLSIQNKFNSKYANRFGSLQLNRFGAKYLNKFGSKYNSKYGDY